jgi:hypothetical protein
MPRVPNPLSDRHLFDTLRHTALANAAVPIGAWGHDEQ